MVGPDPCGYLQIARNYFLQSVFKNKFRQILMGIKT